jgi:phospholipid-binding lipoprotein MlaA
MRPWLLLLGLGCTACVSTNTSMMKDPASSTLKNEEEGNEEEGINDPFEDWNRSALKLNRFLDDTLFFPIFGIYEMMPAVVKQGLSNVLSTIDEPMSMVNCLLQFEVDEFLAHTARFLINTIFGFGGLIDVATELKVTPEPQDFGKTLKKMAGMPPGPFFIIPVIGPTTCRDSIGRLADFAVHPAVFWKLSASIYYPTSYANLKMIYRDVQEQVHKNFDDPYIIIRGAYYEARGDITTSASEETESDILSTAQSIEDESSEEQEKKDQEDAFDLEEENMLSSEVDSFVVIGDSVLPTGKEDSDEAHDATDRDLFPGIDDASFLEKK